MEMTTADEIEFLLWQRERLTQQIKEMAEQDLPSYLEAMRNMQIQRNEGSFH